MTLLKWEAGCHGEWRGGTVSPGAQIKQAVNDVWLGFRSWHCSGWPFCRLPAQATEPLCCVCLRDPACVYSVRVCATPTYVGVLKQRMVLPFNWVWFKQTHSHLNHEGLKKTVRELTTTSRGENRKLYFSIFCHINCLPAHLSADSFVFDYGQFCVCIIRWDSKPSLLWNILRVQFLLCYSSHVSKSRLYICDLNFYIIVQTLCWWCPAPSANQNTYFRTTSCVPPVHSTTDF